MTDTSTPTENQTEIFAQLTKREALKQAIVNASFTFSIESEHQGVERIYMFRDSGATIYGKEARWDAETTSYVDECSLGIIHVRHETIPGVNPAIDPDDAKARAIQFVMNREV